MSRIIVHIDRLVLPAGSNPVRAERALQTSLTRHLSAPSAREALLNQTSDSRRATVSTKSAGGDALGNAIGRAVLGTREAG